MAIVRIYAGSDGKSHVEDITPKFESRGDQSESGELIPGSGIVIRRFEPTRSNPWHHAPGRYAVFTLSGAVDTAKPAADHPRATSSNPQASGDTVELNDVSSSEEYKSIDFP